MSTLSLHGYYRSSTSYRVRIALALKGLEAEQVPINLLKEEVRGDAYLALNPQGLVPTLIVVDDDSPEGSLPGVVTQSLAIMEYLEERWPTPALLPDDPLARAHVRSLCLFMACEMHPLNAPRVLKYLTGEIGVDEAQKLAWYRHWVAEGFSRLEILLTASAGRFCVGDTPGMADACLMPQIHNARRFECDLSAYPCILRIEAACQQEEAFRLAHPSQQADAPHQ
ncbi:maleylacetoacetate isomerase [Cobetia sp. L2A1]|uniref:maleylacetoacetate isomerase n=1 Tax=Cobetia sp. L2A1 TaxID=2686360 RepID=UPI00131B6BAD|nr:maleylacetoacetate isomerase [Cobetia sp. L2A1]